MIPILPFKLPIFTLSSFFSFLSSYGFIMMVLGVCINGSTAAVDVGSSCKLESQFFSFNNFLMHISESDKRWTSGYQLIDGL